MVNKEKKIFYGWYIVGLGALIYFFSGPGQTYSVSVFIDYYISKFGWSRTVISSFYSIATLISGFSLPFIGNLIDSKGHRKSTIAVSILFSITCLWMSMISASWMILIGFVFIRLFGQGSMTLISSVLIPQWFIKKRGRALSIMSLGGVLGAASIPPINNFLIESRGLTFAWMFWAAALIFIMLPAAILFIKNRPEDVGLLPDGVESVENVAESGDIQSQNKIDFSWTLEEAKTTRAFWFMMFCMGVPSLINTGITFHMISIVGEKGYDNLFGAYVLSITALSQIPSNFLAGFVVEKVKVNIVKGINYIVFALAMVIMVFAQGKIPLIIYGVVMGVSVAFDAVSTNVLWSDYYGREHLGKIRGLTMTVMVIGSALGPLPFGAAFDFFNSYTQILLILLILPLMASWASFVSPAPVYSEEEKAI